MAKHFSFIVLIIASYRIASSLSYAWLPITTTSPPTSVFKSESIILETKSKANLNNILLPSSSSFLSSSFYISSYIDNNNDESDKNVALIPSADIKKKMKEDVVIRVIDANTVKLKDSGLVSFAAVQTPSGYSGNENFPECMSVSPSSRAKKLLPSKTTVRVIMLGSENNEKSRALMWRQEDDKLVNIELVRSGMAKPSKRGREETEKLLPGFTNALQQLQEDAKAQKKGLYQTCEEANELRRTFDAESQFEALEWTLETKYTSDGGKPMLRQKDNDGERKPPRNPRDTKGCSDFDTYEDALKWFEYYRPFYGDVAKLDRNNDGIPCPGLPHTNDREAYRMKRPDSIIPK